MNTIMHKRYKEIVEYLSIIEAVREYTSNVTK